MFDGKRGRHWKALMHSSKNCSLLPGIRCCFFSLLTLCLALAHEMRVSHCQAKECKTRVSFAMTFFFCLRDCGTVWENDKVARGRPLHQPASSELGQWAVSQLTHIGHGSRASGLTNHWDPGVIYLSPNLIQADWWGHSRNLVFSVSFCFLSELWFLIRQDKPFYHILHLKGNIN